MAQRTITLQGGTPYKVTAAREEDALPAQFRNDPFVFVHYATAWEYHDTAGFLPSLSAIVATPGVNGVGKDRNMSRAIGGSVAKGGIVIATDDRRLGEYVDYIVTYSVRGGGKHYCFRGISYDILPGGRVLTVDDPGQDLAFRAHLRDAGLVHPLGRAAYNIVLEIERRGLERLEKRVNANPHLAQKLEAKRARVAAIEAAWAKLSEAPAQESAAETEPAVASAGVRKLRPASASADLKAAGARGTIEAPGA
jgi:hypothetical protein